MRTPLLLALVLWGFTARSQQQRMTQAGRHELYLADARALPRLYENKDFDSISYYIQLRWESDRVTPDLFCQAILLSIQRHIFYLIDFHDYNSFTWPMIGELNRYASELAGFRRSREFPDHAPRGYFTRTDQQLFLTTARWASDLIGTQQLDSVEMFMCKVFSGEIRYPEDSLRALISPPPPTHGLFSNRSAVPRKWGGVWTLSSGVWAPERHLSLLGIHPSINYGLGGRNWNNEWDLDVALRFGNSRNPYVINRNDSLLTRTYFDGGNISFDYTRYVTHLTHGELGLSVGLGGDVIDFTASDNPGWSPTGISCFDLNFGVRYNRNFSSHGFLGAVVRYHFLSYNNPGGSPFDGNAATIDIILGYIGKYRR